MSVGIFGRKVNENAIELLQSIISEIENYSTVLFIYEPFYVELIDKIKFSKTVHTFTTNKVIVGKIDFLCSLGGDGTFLDMVTLVKDSGIPLLGINTGRLGFLSSIASDEMKEALNFLRNNNYSIEERTLIKVVTPNNLFGKENYALNDFLLYKYQSSSMVSIHVSINGEFLNSYWADGLIIATPTGSTAYSMSCGGPIIVPDSENFIITPIAPHNLNVRPLVLSDNKTITLKADSRDPFYLVGLDSRTQIANSSMEFKIMKEDFKIKLIKFNNQTFYKTIRNKLMWGLDKRN